MTYCYVIIDLREPDEIVSIHLSRAAGREYISSTPEDTAPYLRIRRARLVIYGR